MSKYKSAMAIQVVPIGISEKKDIYDFVDIAINCIKESGLEYLVGPFETTIEGELEDLLALVARIQKKLIDSGLKTVGTNIKLWTGNIGSTSEKLNRHKENCGRL
ncbi:MAG TPA: thiamine-binding protein [Exilispira sp.]|nr:thiamine-binding protein [Exilispira sp.]